MSRTASKNVVSGEISKSVPAQRARRQDRRSATANNLPIVDQRISATDNIGGVDPDILMQNAALPSVPDAAEDDHDRVVLSNEMRDAFRRFRSSPVGSRWARVARAMAQLMRIRLPYPRQIEAMGELEELRLMGRDMRGDQQLGLTIFERTGCGKSTAVAQYRALLLSESAPDTMPVVHARLGTAGTARDMYVAILSSLGDGFAMSGTEHTLRQRAMSAMSDARTELLVIDEAHHGGRKTGFSQEITAELKIMLDTGQVAIVLLGTEEAVPIVGSDQEFSGRLFSPCRLAPLDMDDDEDWDLWSGFLDALDERMVADNIVTDRAGLANEDIAAALGEVCDGIIGQVMRVMLMALRETTRDQRSVITLPDLRTAVDQWSIELGFAKTNPFERL